MIIQTNHIARLSPIAIHMLFYCSLFLAPLCVSAEETSEITSSRRVIHRIGVDIRPSYILPTKDFLWGENPEQKIINQSISAHLKYSFRFQPNTLVDRIYGGAYQGVGLAYNSFGEPYQIGNPISFYLFQGARIKQLHQRLSLNYEWNFGLSAGWHPYDYETNPYNTIVGSKVNAYMNLNFYFDWAVSTQVHLTAGADISHFSNGNTKFPNCGLNTAGLKLGVVYNLNRNHRHQPHPMYQPLIPLFERHVSYDLMLFGSWRRKGCELGELQIPSPESYTVLGFNFNPMYNLGYKVRVGASLDGVYDGSANVYTEDFISGTEPEFFTPPFRNQWALGLSARGEFVMPYFSVGCGLGVNVLHGGGDLSGFYQILALKIKATHNTFIHIGYNLQNFKTPNYLMLGLGYCFNNRRR